MKINANQFDSEIEIRDFGNGWGLFIDIEDINVYKKKQDVYIKRKNIVYKDFYKINVY